MNNTQLLKNAVKRGLKIGYIDLETSPALVWTYSFRDTFIPPSSIEEDFKITSVAILVEGETKVKVFEWGKERDDKKLLEKFLPLLDGLDIVVAQNGDAFDIKILKWRASYHKMEPPKNILSLDTLKLSRQAFRPSSHKLDYRSQSYGLGGKLHQDMSDCIAVAKGDRKAQKIRVEYNVKDVIDLRTIFWRELNYYKLPVKMCRDLGIIDPENKREACPNCKGRSIHKKGKSTTKTKSYQDFQCQGCGHWFQRSLE